MSRYQIYYQGPRIFQKKVKMVPHSMQITTHQLSLHP